MSSSFKTNPIKLSELLADGEKGMLQLPDFQRSWVWDEDRIRSLLASISRAFPVGAIMTLGAGDGAATSFKARPLEGAPNAAKEVKPAELLLDGQQRLTSLYQATLRNKPMATRTPKNKPVQRWFYFDMRKAVDPNVDREDAIVGVPENKIIVPRGRNPTDLDLSTRDKEYAAGMYPLSAIFSWAEWHSGYMRWCFETRGGFDQSDHALVDAFRTAIVQNFEFYSVPVIALDKSTSKEAVCTVFEKVNTGGKPLDAFELVTAMYAAEGHELRKDWLGDAEHEGRQKLFQDLYRPSGRGEGILSDVASTDFLQVISLFHSRDKRRQAEAEGKTGNDLPQVTGKREALLNLPLDAYLKYEERAETGFKMAARFLHTLHIYKLGDLPYQSQITALAAILADIGQAYDQTAVRQKLERWYWCGVFGELYGSAVDTRISRDFLETPAWLLGSAGEPTTVSEASFHPDRLNSMRMRVSAAYLGLHVLLMKIGAEDFITGDKFDHIVFFDQNVDIHHIFPQAWCKAKKLEWKDYDCVINKTPLTDRTNRIIGGGAPSEYLARLEAGSEKHQAVPTDKLDPFLRSHLIDPALLRADDFDAFMRARKASLLSLIETAMGKAPLPIVADNDAGDDDVDEDGAPIAAE